MKRRFIIIIFLFSTNFALGQIYHPLIRAGVYFDTMSGDGTQLCNYSGGGRLFFQDDTLIQGTTYSKIQAYPVFSFFVNPYCPPYYVDTFSTYESMNYLREDTVTKKIYIYQQSTQTEDLLYDFNLQGGDTLNSIYAGMGMPLVVDSVSTVTLLDGNVRDVYYLNSGEYYIESIGGSQGILGPLIQGLGFWTDVPCVLENSIKIWGDGSTSCYDIVSISETLDNDRIIIEPTIAKDFINITIPNYLHTKINIFDLYGHQILEQECVQSTIVIDVSDFKSALYCAVITDNTNKKTSGRFIIQR